jgi:quercetin dioxygenase-like cupin family protein
MDPIRFARPDRAQAKPTPSPEYFQGTVHMQHLVSKEQSQDLELIAVFFADGARTLPHVHTTDQVLWVLEGTCVVGQRSGRREIGPGECAHIPAGSWHWHGARAGTAMCHVSIRKPGPTDWTVSKEGW